MISGILLAAGNSFRMGEENKLLLPVNGQPLFMNMIQAMEGSKLDELIVVLGHDYRTMMDLCQSSRLKLAVNGSHMKGQTSSIKAGMQLLNPSTNAVMICLCDMPLIQSEHLDALLAEYEEGKILRPMKGERPGNPAIFPSILFDELINCDEKEGCSMVITNHTKHLKKFSTDASAYFRDIDTPEEYANFVS